MESTFILNVTERGANRPIQCADQGSFRECVIEATTYAYCNRRSNVVLSLVNPASADGPAMRFDLFSIGYKQIPVSAVDALAASRLTDEEISDLIGQAFKRG